MKRDELIEKLQELPEDAEIRIETGCGCCADEDEPDLRQSCLYPNKYLLS